jgi:hypothetical protein
MTDEGSRHEGVSRRRWLSLAGGSVPLALTGCLGGDDNDDPGSSNDTAPGDGPTPDDTDNGPGTNPDAPSADPALLQLAVDSIRGPVEFVAGTERPITVTLANQGDDRGVLTVDLVVTPVSDAVSGTSTGAGDEDAGTADDPVVSASRSQRLEPGEEHRFTFDRITEDLPGGQYTLAATAGTDTLTQSVTVTATTDVTVDVYTTAVDDEHRATDGTVTLVAHYAAGFTETVTTADLGGTPSATLTVPLADDQPTDYTIEVTNVNGGTVPDATRDVTIADPDDGGFEIVAGYEFQGIDACRFSEYFLYYPEDATSTGQVDEWFLYGTYAQNGDYHVYYAPNMPYGTDSTTFTPDPYFDVQAPMHETSPLEYGTEFQVVGRSGFGYHSLFHDGQYFYYTAVNHHWRPGDVATGRRASIKLIGINGLGAVTTPEEREFVGTKVIQGIEADVFEIDTTVDGSSHMGTRVYTDSETGHVVRVERDTLNTDKMNTIRNEKGGIWEIVEFFDHGEPETVDWDLLNSRSKHRTGPDSDGKTLDGLPWE